MQSLQALLCFAVLARVLDGNAIGVDVERSSVLKKSLEDGQS
jgi:hypothetical protein